MRTLQSTHRLRSHYFSLSVRGYQGSKVCSVTNGGMGGKKWEMCTDEVSSRMQMKDFPSLLGGISSKVINTVTAAGVAGRARSSEQNDNHMKN